MRVTVLVTLALVSLAGRYLTGRVGRLKIVDGLWTLPASRSLLILGFLMYFGILPFVGLQRFCLFLALEGILDGV